MKTKRSKWITFCALFVMVISAHAYTSMYGRVAAVGDFNHWQTSPNLMLVADYTWQGEFHIFVMSNRFKFVANNDTNSFFGESDQSPNFSPPVTGAVDVASGGDITITNTPSGLYRITFNDSNLNYRAELLYTDASDVNMVKNPSFEDANPALTNGAQRWTYSVSGTDANDINNPIPKRRYYSPWSSHSGSWEAVIEGQWSSERRDFGWWFQSNVKPIDGANMTPGLTYQGAAWFFSGAAWTSQLIELTFEFYDVNGYQISVVRTNFASAELGNERWIKKTLQAVVPEGASKATLLIASSGNGSQDMLRIDDAEVRAVATRSQNFDNWINFPNFTIDGVHSWDDWLIDTGKIVERGNYYCASLPYSAGSSNFVRSPRLLEGLGSISFWYRHDNANPAVPISFTVEKSYDSNTWTTIATVTNISTTNEFQYRSYRYDEVPCYIRIVHRGGNARLLLDDITIDLPVATMRYQDFDAWPDSTDNGRHEYGNWIIDDGRINSVNSLNEKAAEIAGGGSNTLRSPLFSSGIGTIDFWYRRGTNNANPVTFTVQMSTNGTNWESIETLNNVTNTDYQHYSKYMYETRSLYVQIHHDAGDNTLLLDEIDVDYPILLRLQNFEDWPSQDNYGTYAFYGWTVNDGQIVATNAYEGKVARLSDAPSNQYIQSARMPEGIGMVSFVYARGTNTASPTNVYYQLQLSEDGITWTSNDAIHVTSTNYTLFEKYFYDTTNHYLRLYHESGGEIVSFDNISIGAPSPRADVVLDAWSDPLNPSATDPAYLHGSVISRYDASVLSVTGYYRLGTSGPFTALSMVMTDGVSFVSASVIPAQPVGATVQYYLRCDFSGPGSESNTPRYYPSGGSNNPASYSISRNPWGKVWINELNYINGRNLDDDTNEFVEICGPSGLDIGGWKIEFYVHLDTDTTCYASYTIPNHTLLSSNVDGYGFYVLGDQESFAADQRFTHTNDVWWDGYNSQISDGNVPSGIRLINEGNGVEQSLAYGGSIPGFLDLGVEDRAADSDNSLQLAGSGACYTSFTWRANSLTPRAVNIDQFFRDMNAAIKILAISCAATQITINAAFTNAAGWTPDAFYVANLSTNPLTNGVVISPRDISTNLCAADAGLWSIRFAYPLGESNGYFRVRAKP